MDGRDETRKIGKLKKDSKAPFDVLDRKTMKPRNPDYRRHATAIIRKSPFVHDIGLVLDDLGPGWCETHIDILPKHQQQDGYIHAGVQATLADHTAGGATGTLVPAGYLVLSAEFKINFLRPAIGERIRCRATVLKAGNTLFVAESEVFAVRGGEEKLVSKATVTLAPVPGRASEGPGPGEEP
jgi:uncharacterized protein (TIGR00369 family)